MVATCVLTLSRHKNPVYEDEMEIANILDWLIGLKQRLEELSVNFTDI